MNADDRRSEAADGASPARKDNDIIELGDVHNLVQNQRKQSGECRMRTDLCRMNARCKSCESRLR